MKVKKFNENWEPKYSEIERTKMYFELYNEVIEYSKKHVKEFSEKNYVSELYTILDDTISQIEMFDEEEYYKFKEKLKNINE